MPSSSGQSFEPVRELPFLLLHLLIGRGGSVMCQVVCHFVIHLSAKAR